MFGVWHRVLRVFGGFVLALALSLPLPSHAQTDVPNEIQHDVPKATEIVRVDLESLELAAFEPNYIGRSGFSTAKVLMRFSYQLNETGVADRPTLLQSARDLTRGVLLTEVSGDLYLSSPVEGFSVAPQFSVEGTSGLLVAQGYVSVSGSIVPFYSGVLGRTLRFKVGSRELSVASNVQDLRVSGITSDELMALMLILVPATSALLLGGYLRWRNQLKQRVSEPTGLPPSDPFREWIDETRKSEGETSPPLSPPKVPEQLVEALMQHQAMLCVGSGLSVVAGVPGLQQITLSVARAFESELTKGMKSTIVKLAGTAGPFSASDASPLIEALVGRVGRSRVDSEIRRLVSGKAADLTLHRRLANLPWHGIVSLTWDDVMDRAALANNSDGEMVRILPQDVEQLRKAISDNIPFIVDAFSAAGDLVLTSSDFERQLDRYPAYARQLALLLDTDQFLFIGISPQTLVTYLRAFGHGVRDESERHFALVPFHSSNELFQATLSEFGVALLEYDPGWGDSELVAFIDRLKDQFEARETDATPSSSGTKLEQIRIERLALANIGPFRNTVLEISNQLMPDGGGQWTVILGQNGAGKSILLKAIALALVTNEEGARSAAAAMLSWGASEGSINLVLGRLTLTTEFFVDRGEVVIRKTSRSTPVEAGYALVIGFPALRGAPAADPKSFRQLPSPDPRPSDLMPLISGGIDPRMAEFKQWIFNILKSAQGGSENKENSIKKLLDDIVSELVPGNFIGFADFDETEGICLKRVDGVKVPLFSVSSGMSSIFNWVGVVVPRLYDVYPNSVTPNEEWAVVLIDEIDVHLHPDWQRRLVELVKRFFPNLQVLATTHSPLIASSLEREEVRVVHLDGSIDVPTIETYGRSADEIMQSDIGGLRNARPLAVEKQIVEYNELYVKAERSTEESQRLSQLRDELGLSVHANHRPDMELPSEEALAEIKEKFKSKRGVR